MAPPDAAEPDDAALAALQSLPGRAWQQLTPLVRGALDRMDRAALPAVVRPFAGWRATDLGGHRPRRALMTVLVDDARIRQELGEVAPAADGSPPGAELVQRLGLGPALARLVADGRWSEVRSVAALPTAAAPGAGGAAGSGPTGSGSRAARERPASADDIQQALASARRELRAETSRRAAAEQRAAEAAAAYQAALSDLDAARARIAALDEELGRERSRTRERLARVQRRAVDAESRARGAQTTVSRLEAELRALREAAAGEAGDQVDETTSRTRTAPDAVDRRDERLPRSVPPAQPSRPCVLPAGLDPDSPDAVRSLLQAFGIELLVDGYNVTKDAAGKPDADLPNQRAWLLGLLAGVAARWRRAVTVVFDSPEDRPGSIRAPRGVQVVFASGASADERIARLVEASPPARPLLVVTTDREVREHARRHGADVATSRAFLLAVRA